MISFFRAPIKNITPEAQVSILQIYKYIIGGYAQDVTNRLRSIADHHEARRFKAESFDYVTFSGCFSTRHNAGLLEHSGFLCFDIDKIESERRLQEIKSLLINDEELHTVLCFRSPSGNGLKWVVEVPDRYWLGVSHTDDLFHTENMSHTELTENTEDAVASPAILSPTDDTDNSDIKSSFSSIRSLAAQEVARRIDTDFTPSECLSHTEDRVQITDVIVKNHRVLYERIRGYLFERYGIETDHTSDIARPCYLCHDVDAYYDEPNFKDNPASRFLKITEYRLQITDNRVQSTNKNNNDYENDIGKIVREIEHRRLDITNDYYDWMLVAMALAGTCGTTGEHYFHRISQFHPKYDNAEAHRMYQSCVRNTHGAVGIGTIVYLMNR